MDREAVAEASLRISASLDLETVLQEVVDSARALTVARAAFIATMDDAGAPEDFFASGITEEVFRSLLEWPDGPKVFEHVRALDEPLRVEDFSKFLRGLGFSGDLVPAKIVLGMPMRHRGAHVGNFYLVEKAGGRPFTGEDEETLALLASQAAAAIANARTYRDERQARADLTGRQQGLPKLHWHGWRDDIFSGGRTMRYLMAMSLAVWILAAGPAAAQVAVGACCAGSDAHALLVPTGGPAGGVAPFSYRSVDPRRVQAGLLDDLVNTVMSWFSDDTVTINQPSEGDAPPPPPPPKPDTTSTEQQ